VTFRSESFPRSCPVPAGGAAILLWAVMCCLAGAAVGGVHVLGRPGFLVISGAADTTGHYAWRSGPGPRERSLVWPDGVLTVPQDLPLESFGPHDLAVPTGSDLAGITDGGALVFGDGLYAISAPLLLSDGSISAYLAAGELEIVGERVRYLPPPPDQPADSRAGFIMLAGVLLLVVVLLRLARRRSGRSGRK
jgi:hypothetical protein